MSYSHVKSGDRTPVLQWLKKEIEESEMCHYWYIIIDLMLNLLIFVRSVREGNFNLFVSSLKQVLRKFLRVISVTGSCVPVYFFVFFIIRIK